MKTLEAYWNAITATISNLWKFTGSLPYLRAIITITLAVIVIIAYFNCGEDPSKTEREIHKSTGESIEQSATTKVAANEVEAKEKEAKTITKSATEAKVAANKAVKKAEKARTESTAGVSYTEANTRRCAAYPESSECL